MRRRHDIDIVRALREWEDGERLEDITQRHGNGASTGSVYRWIIAAGGERRKGGGLDRLDGIDLPGEYRSGATIKQLADRHGTSQSAMRDRLIALGVQLRGRGPAAGHQDKWADLPTFGRPGRRGEQ